MSIRKALVVTFIIMAMFLGILIIIAKLRPGSLPVMAYAFAVPGIIYITKLLFRWLVDEGRH